VDTSVSLTLAGKYWPRSRWRWRASGAEHAVLLIVDQIDPCRKSSEDRSRNEGAVPRSAPLLRRSLFDTVRYGDPFRRGSRKIPAPWSDVEALLFFFSFFLLRNRPPVRPSVRPSIGPASSEISITFLTRLIPVVSRWYRGPRARPRSLAASSRVPGGGEGWRSLTLRSIVITFEWSSFVNPHAETILVPRRSSGRCSFDASGARDARDCSWMVFMDFRLRVCEFA